MYYVYRFLDKSGDVIYVGRTENLKNRIKQHFSSSGHLSGECYDKVDVIEYTTFNTKPEMDIYEIYYINKWKPKYNTMDKHDVDMKLELNSVWSVYWTENKEYVNRLKKFLNKLENKCKELEVENQKLLATNDLLVEYYNESESKDKTDNSQKGIVGLFKEDIIKIYQATNSNKLEFYSKVMINDRLESDMVIYQENGILYASNKIKDNYKTPFYDLNRNEYIDDSWCFALALDYIPNDFVAYKILQNILTKEMDDNLSKYNLELTTKELENVALSLQKENECDTYKQYPHVYEIITDDRYSECVFFIYKNKINVVNIEEKIDIDMTPNEFIKKFNHNLFKYHRYEHYQGVANNLQSKINTINTIMNVGNAA